MPTWKNRLHGSYVVQPDGDPGVTGRSVERATVVAAACRLVGMA